LLRFVVERHLDGRDNALKESVIALEVFGNRDYDPKQDSIVRTEMARLRARLAEYYLREGTHDQVLIELPKGRYIPVFRQPNEPRGEPRTRRHTRIWFMAALVGLAIALPATGWWWTQRKITAVSIAVLPLENLNHDPTSDYFSDGLTDELIRNLSIIDGLEVRSHTSSFAFKGRARDLREVGKELRADYILEGSILRADPELRINTRLVRVRDDVPVWSGRYDQNLTDVLAIQDEISRGIINELRLTLGRGRRRYETSVEAYDLYLRARTVSTGLDGSQSIGLFEQAVAKDPSFAPAYAGLATAHAFQSGLPNSDRTDELAKMLNAARKAIELDPLLAEAHDALGTAYARDGQWERSEKSFRRALELDRNRSLSYEDFSLYLLLPLGRIEEGSGNCGSQKRTIRSHPRCNTI
jgi:TolB-like protein